MLTWRATAFQLTWWLRGKISLYKNMISYRMPAQCTTSIFCQSQTLRGPFKGGRGISQLTSRVQCPACTTTDNSM